MRGSKVFKKFVLLFILYIFHNNKPPSNFNICGYYISAIFFQLLMTLIKILINGIILITITTYIHSVGW